MRTFLSAIVVVGFVSVFASPALAAGACPADPAKASTAIWPSGFLKMNEEETGEHPCGKKTSCHGGNPRRGIGRRCQWL